MNAEPLLARVARSMSRHRLEAVLVGNAAAALQGSPVTTIDFDFMFRDTPANVRKLKAVARSLGATILRPFYPVSSLYRVVNDDLGLQIDLLARLHGFGRSHRFGRGRRRSISKVLPSGLRISKT